MTALEFHRRAIECGQLLQSLGGNHAHLIRAAAVRMQHGNATTI
ncbi:hypothetical protein [Rhodanobacter sp. MP7CTX1]|nr:hypothetical protein [Rhodanobacter sp. MP7CTX1]MBB6189784.1 hypothetical protein [Rhodanobacter sp. MP7CTX1]